MKVPIHIVESQWLFNFFSYLSLISEVDNEIVSTADNGKSAKFPRLSSNFQRMNDFPTPSTSSASYCQSSRKYNEGYDSESGSETDGERGVSFNNRDGNRKTQDKEIVLTPAEKMILREIKSTNTIVFVMDYICIYLFYTVIFARCQTIREIHRAKRG